MHKSSRWAGFQSAMGYYLRVVSTLDAPFAEIRPQVWKIENDIAVRVGVTNPEAGPGTHFKAEPGERIWEAIRRMTPWFEPYGQCPIHKAVLNPGEFYSRGWRARPTSAGMKRRAGVPEHKMKPASSPSRAVS